MKIGLNATCFNSRASGAKNRFIDLYKLIFNKKTNYEFIIYEPFDYNISDLFIKKENLRFVKTKIPSYGRFFKFFDSKNYWNQISKYEKLDVFESFNLPVFNFPKSKNIITMHDIRDIYSYFPKKNLYYYILKKSLYNANHTIAVSDYLKEKLLKLFPDINIHVINNGIDKNRFQIISKDELNYFLKKYSISKDFILSVGHFEKRKNYNLIIDSLYYLNKKDWNQQIVLIGNDNGDLNHLKNYIRKKNLQNKVIILTNINDYELNCAFQSASLFVFPSKYEGFGIPILECMQVGLPIILSNIEVFKQITDSKLIYFDPNSSEDLADKIIKVYHSNEYKNFSKIYFKKRIEDFNLDLLSEKIIDLYKL